MSIKQNEYQNYFEIFENHKEETSEELEEFAFTKGDGTILDDQSRLIREYLKIDTMFTFDSGEELSFEQSNHIKGLITDLGYAIECTYDDDNDYNHEVLKRIIVLLDICLGVEVSFYTALREYELDQKLEADLEILSLSNFGELYNVLEASYKNGRKK